MTRRVTTSCITARTRRRRFMRRPTCRGRRSPAAQIFYRVGHQPGHFDLGGRRGVRRDRHRARHGVKVAYDTNYRPRLWPPARAAAVMHAAIARADYVFPGMEDALVLTGLTDPDAIAGLLSGARLPGRGAENGRGGRVSRGRRAPRAHRAASGAGGGRDRGGRHVLRLVPCAHPGGRHGGAAARYANVAAALKCTGYGAVAPIPRPADVLRILEV